MMSGRHICLPCPARLPKGHVRVLLWQLCPPWRCAHAGQAQTGASPGVVWPCLATLCPAGDARAAKRPPWAAVAFAKEGYSRRLYHGQERGEVHKWGSGDGVCLWLHADCAACKGKAVFVSRGYDIVSFRCLSGEKHSPRPNFSPQSIGSYSEGLLTHTFYIARSVPFLADTEDIRCKSLFCKNFFPVGRYPQPGRERTCP